MRMVARFARIGDKRSRLPPQWRGRPMMSSSWRTASGWYAAVPAYAGYAAARAWSTRFCSFLAFLIDNAVMGIGFVLI